MATNTSSSKFSQAMAQARRSGTSHNEYAPLLLSPSRVVLAVACLVAVVMMLATIAGVARAQVHKGQAFNFAEPASPMAAPTLYSSRGGADATDLDGGLQRVSYAR